MAFHFTLSSLLRLRESLAKLELQRLQSIAAQLAQVRTQIEMVEAEIEDARRQVFDQTLAGISGAELHAALASEAIRQERRTMLLTRKAELEKAREAQIVRYAEARKRRQILSNLRERQFSAYQIEQARKEQQRIDELFLIRRGARKNAGHDFGSHHRL